jgi:Fe-S-cluster containining protein
MNCKDCNGACCRDVTFPIYGELDDVSKEWLDVRGVRTKKHRAIIPIICPQLTEDGRCRIYEDRPQACREFECGSASCLEARKFNYDH